MKLRRIPNVIALAATALAITAANAQSKPIRVDVARDKVGAEPSTFIPMVGNWVVADE